MRSRAKTGPYPLARTSAINFSVSIKPLPNFCISTTFRTPSFLHFSSYFHALRNYLCMTHEKNSTFLLFSQRLLYLFAAIFFLARNLKKLMLRKYFELYQGFDDKSKKSINFRNASKRLYQNSIFRHEFLRLCAKYVFTILLTSLF